MQDAITPPGQNTRNVLMFASFLALPVLGVHQLGWLIGLTGLAASFVASSIIRALLPKPNSTFFFQTILRGLADRRAKFAGASDDLRVEATDAVLARLMDAFEAHHDEAAV
jgi:predicted membrane-bound spermidine synthase